MLVCEGRIGEAGPARGNWENGIAGKLVTLPVASFVNPAGRVMFGKSG
jgi:hypothetical protein